MRKSNVFKFVELAGLVLFSLLLFSFISYSVFSGNSTLSYLFFLVFGCNNYIYSCGLLFIVFLIYHIINRFDNVLLDYVHQSDIRVFSRFLLTVIGVECIKVVYFVLLVI